MTSRKYEKLCVKDFAGDISVEEKCQLNTWLEKSPYNQSVYNELSQIWKQAKPPSIPETINRHSEWQRLQSRIETSMPKGSKKRIFVWDSRKRKNQTFMPALKPISWAFVSLVIVFGGLLLIKIRLAYPPMEEIITQNQEKIEYILADGTQVRLNTQSKLLYQKNFSDSTRWVYLEGEAFFNVSTNGKPFIVYTEQAKTIVLGTRFNVRARLHETRVIVKEGCVRISRIKEIPNALTNRVPIEDTNSTTKIPSDQNRNVNQTALLLTPNQMGEISDTQKSMKKTAVDAEYLLGWLEGRLVFNQTPLSEIIDELERQYDVTIQLTQPEIGNKTMTAVYENETIEEILYSISLALGVQCTVENKNQFTMN